MGALSAVLAIPYRSVKESIEKNRRDKNKNKRQTISSPGSLTPSIYTKAGGALSDKKNKVGDTRREYKEKSQSLGHLPLVEVPRAGSCAEKETVGKGKGIERPSLQKQNTQLRTTVQRDFPLESAARVPVVA